MGRIRRSDEAKWEQLWRERVAQWQASGETQKKFCELQGLPRGSVGRWQRKLERRDQLQSLQAIAASVESAEPLSWTEVRVEPCGSAGPAPWSGPGVVQRAEFEVLHPHGWLVRMGSCFEAESLRRLLSVLSEQPC